MQESRKITRNDKGARYAELHDGDDKLRFARDCAHILRYFIYIGLPLSILMWMPSPERFVRFHT